MRIDLAQAGAEESQGGYLSEGRTAERAAARAEAQGARLIVARAKLREGAAYSATGDLEKARAAYHDAESVYATVGDRSGMADSLSGIGMMVYLEATDFPLARKNLEQALAIARETGDKKREGDALRHIGIMFHHDREIADARKKHSDALAISREIGDTDGEAQALKDIGNVSLWPEDLKNWRAGLAVARQSTNPALVASLLDDIAAADDQYGHPRGAEKTYEEELAIERKIGTKNQVAFALCNSGEAMFDAGDLSGAAERYQAALMMFRGASFKSRVTWAIEDIAEVMYEQDDLSGAERMYHDAEALEKEIGNKDEEIHNPLVPALLLIEAGKPAEAAAQVCAVSNKCEGETVDSSQSEAVALFARCLLLEGKQVEARSVMERAARLAAKARQPAWRIRAAPDLARVRAATGESGRALKDLEATLREAHSLGYTGYELEIRLAQCEIQSKFGREAEAQVMCQSLERDARGRGFNRIARKAAAGRKALPVASR